MEKAPFTGDVAVTLGRRRRRAPHVGHRALPITATSTFDGPVPIVKTFGFHVVRMSGGWTDLAPGRDDRASRRPTSTRCGAATGPVVAGRPTALARDPRRGRLRERMAIDRELGVVLRREQLDDAAGLVRRVEFTIVRRRPHREAPRTADSSSGPSTASAMGVAVPAPYRAPPRSTAATDASACTGGARSSRSSTATGCTALSVFEQPGQLDWEALPSAVGRSPSPGTGPAATCGRGAGS